jgi:hypothetical protein
LRASAGLLPAHLSWFRANEALVEIDARGGVSATSVVLHAAELVTMGTTVTNGIMAGNGIDLIMGPFLCPNKRDDELKRSVAA